MKPYYILIPLALLFLGCESQLNLSPITNLTDATFYKNEDDAKSVVNACYAYLTNTTYGTDGMMFLDLVTTDDGVPFLTGVADRPMLWRYTITPAIGFNGLYGASYAGINRCNTVIDRLPAIKMNEPLKQRFMAEAKFIRALHYFNLVQFHGGVPLKITETTSLEGLDQSRNSVEEVYAQIEKDLKEAESVLPKSYTGADIGRATQGAAKGLLAKVYLTRAGNTKGSPFWAAAAAKAKEVIDLGVYDLLPNFGDVFSLSSRGSKEMVFEVQFLTDVRGNTFGTGYGVRGIPLYPGAGSGIARVTPSLFNAYSASDKRKNVTFQTSYTQNGNTVQLSVTDPDPTKAVAFQKFWDKTAKTNQGGISFPVLRYSDVLLVYAEALNEMNNGPTTESYGAINKVRSRAGIEPLTGLNYQDFKEAVLNERRLEFAFECQRRFDLVRTGRLIEAVKAENSFSRNASIQPFHVLLPIPQSEMDANKNLVQNTGY